MDEARVTHFVPAETDDDGATIWERALRLWGREAQMAMVREELTELLLELERLPRGRTDKAKILGELADVVGNTLPQLLLMIGASWEEVREAFARKQAVLQLRIERAEATASLRRPTEDG